MFHAHVRFVSPSAILIYYITWDILIYPYFYLKTLHIRKTGLRHRILYSIIQKHSNTRDFNVQWLLNRNSSPQPQSQIISSTCPAHGPPHQYVHLIPSQRLLLSQWTPLLGSHTKHLVQQQITICTLRNTGEIVLKSHF